MYEISNGEFIEELLLVELYSVPIAGPASASVRLDRSTEPAPGLRPYRYQVSADSAWVVYAATDDNFDQWLVSVPTAGPASASTVMTWPATEVPVFTISPDSTRVIHSWESGSLPVLLLSTPIDHPAGSVRINGDEDPGARLLINASSTRVVYRNGFDLFSAPNRSTAPRSPVNRSPSAGGSCTR